MKAVQCAIVGVCLLAGCTSVGIHDEAVRALVLRPDRPPTTIRLCAYLDEGIDRQEAENLLAAAWDAEVENVGIAWQLTRVGRYARPAYTYFGLRSDVDSIPLPEDCDRLMVFLGRHVGDAIYGLFALGLPLPEVLGYADDRDRLRGYVVARRATFLQVFMPPASMLRHELYHMLGCEHHLSMADCYEAISEMRRVAGWIGYFPGWEPENRRAVRLPGR